jgi:hypothetical protein
MLLTPTILKIVTCLYQHSHLDPAGPMTVFSWSGKLLLVLDIAFSVLGHVGLMTIFYRLMTLGARKPPCIGLGYFLLVPASSHSWF